MIDMTNQEEVKKSLVTISLPRSYYDRFMEAHLWEDFASFSDMVRDAVRKSLAHYEVMKRVEYTKGERVEREGRAV